MPSNDAVSLLDSIEDDTDLEIEELYHNQGIKTVKALEAQLKAMGIESPGKDALRAKIADMKENSRIIAGCKR